MTTSTKCEYCKLKEFSTPNVDLKTSKLRIFYR